MTNGGTGPYKGKILLMNQGRGDLPANMVLVDPEDPSNVVSVFLFWFYDKTFPDERTVFCQTVLLDNYYGRQFISLNDVKVHSSGEIFFTDVP